MTTDVPPLPIEVESASTNSIREQLYQSLSASGAYRNAFVEEKIRTGLTAQIKAMRESRRMDYKKFAGELGKSIAWTYRLEDPNESTPTIPSLLAVAKAFDVDLRVEFGRFSRLLKRLENLDGESFDIPSFDKEVRAGVFIERMAPRSETRRLSVGNVAPFKGNKVIYFQRRVPNTSDQEAINVIVSKGVYNDVV